jgi:ribonuclease Z
MLPFEVTILGSSSAIPTATRNPSAQVVSIRERFFLVDCGEGTQIQIRRHRIKLQKINHIFISHLHGDHYLGLVGLLGSLHLLGRTKAMHVYAPEGLKEIIDIQHHYSQTFLRYPLEIHTIAGNNMQLLWEDDKVEVHAFPLQHRIPTYGFLFKEKPWQRKVIVEKIQEYNIPTPYIPQIKNGSDFVKTDGSIIPNEMLTYPPPPPRSYAYCSDTRFYPEVCQWIKGVNLLYHEATFEEQHKVRAKETSHSTGRDAGEIAKLASAGKLLLGHFSIRYDSTKNVLAEAREVFENCEAVEEGKKYEVC